MFYIIRNIDGEYFVSTLDEDIRDTIDHRELVYSFPNKESAQKECDRLNMLRKLDV